MTSSRGLLALVALGLAAVPLTAQDGPPPPLPPVEVRAPEVHELPLPHGARLVVVPHREVPFVSVRVVVPGGSAVDPVGREGTATFVARLLDRGTRERPFHEIAAALDRRGITLAASAAEEWSMVSIDALTPALDAGLEILAEVLTEPSFPEEQLELTRTQARTGLQLQASRGGPVADLTFLRRVYGAHPYGRLPTPASVGAIGRDDLVAFHDRWYRPDGALVVVAGDVDPDDIRRRLEDALAGWRPSSAPAPPADPPRAPDRDRPEIVLVHRPGAVQAEIRIGHLLMGGDVEGWEALVVANQVLGGGPSGRLQQVLRSALGYTYDARSAVTRLPRLGLFRIATATRHEVAAATIEEVYRQVERLRGRALAEAELDARLAYLTGSYPRTIETPQQVADALLEQRLIVGSDDVLDPGLARYRALDTAAVRRAAELHIRPEQFLVVVSGDATVLQPQLRIFGEVQTVDAAGDPLTLADLEPSPPVVDLAGLRPDTLHYDVVVGGGRRGAATRILEPVEGGWRFASVIEAGLQRLEQEMIVDREMRMLASATTVRAPTGDQSISVQRDGSRLVGERRVGDDVTPLAIEVPEGATLADGIELALRALPLEVGHEFHLEVVDLADGTLRTVAIRVEERAPLTTSAGTIDTFRVHVGGDDPQLYHLLVDAPHVAVRMESLTRPIALELTALPALARR